jgi:hypothetical protein
MVIVATNAVADSGLTVIDTEDGLAPLVTNVDAASAWIIKKTE